MNLLKITIVLFSAFYLHSCGSGKQAKVNDKTMISVDRKISFGQGEQAVVYKTRKDYTNLVPVTMDDSRTKILSYPAPADLFRGGQLSKPTLLKNGYLLDNRGVGENVAFLSYTYEQYSKLEEAPSMQDMLGKIVDKWPLTELINCGLRYQYKDEVPELNQLVDNGFEGCKRIEVKKAPQIKFE